MDDFIEKSEREHGGWVIDGNWGNLLGDSLEIRTTDIICTAIPSLPHILTVRQLTGLDPPLALYFPRLVLRTFLRLFRIREPCSPGCWEMWSEVFLSRDSIIWWCLTHHASVREKELAKVERDRSEGAEVTRDAGGEVVGRRRRIGGWGSEYEAWKNAIALFARSR